MRPICFLLAGSVLLMGGMIMANGFGLCWQGFLAGLVGMFAIWLGSRDEEPAAHGRPYSPEDFPFPPSTPGARFAKAGSANRPADDAVEALAVICPRADAGPDGLRAIGAALRDWWQSTPDVLRIEGMAPMLEGRYPRTPTRCFLSPTCTVRLDDREMDELTRSEDAMPVAVVIVSGRACNKKTGASLLHALDGLPLAMVVDPLFYDAITR
jgi:hypothetical protein